MGNQDKKMNDLLNVSSPMNTKGRQLGFTLIELLIVVAIIGILAAIAVPNFLNAQVRAKVSRAQADLRTISTAVASYAVDHNGPPPSTHGNLGDTSYGYIRFNLTTPVAYLATGLLVDPFFKPYDDEAIRGDEQYYTYHNVKWYQENASWPSVMLRFYGTWRACSYGPDGRYANGSYGVRIYDSSNGLNSEGNIWVSEKSPRVTGTPKGYF